MTKLRIISKQKTKNIILGTILLLFLIVYLFPVLWMIRASFLPRLEAFYLGLSLNLTLDNYLNILKGSFLQNILNSFIISTFTVILSLCFSLPASYAFSRFNFTRKDDLYFFFLTIRMAPAVAFVLPYYIMYTTLGLFDTYHGMVIVQSIANVPLSIWLLKGFIDAIPKEVEEAAMVDGCSRSGVILRITLPLLAPAIVITGTLVFLFVWNEFFYAMILTRSVAQPFTVVLPVLLGRVKLKWEEMCAAATVVSIIPIILTIVTRKYLIKGLGLGLRI